MDLACINSFDYVENYRNLLVTTKINLAHLTTKGNSTFEWIKFLYLHITHLQTCYHIMLEKYNFEMIDNKVNKDLKRVLCQTLEIGDTKISWNIHVFICVRYVHGKT